MLLQLGIRHLALIDDVEISLCNGMNVLTGETGAGKSIVVDAVNLVLGERADRDMIAEGMSRASVEALFDISENQPVRDLLKEEEIETEDNTLSVTREILSSGRNICRLNGSMVSLQMIRRVSSLLLDIHGQHEHQLLLDAQHHMAYLDSFDSEHIVPIRLEVAEKYRQWHEAVTELKSAHLSEGEREQRMDMLRFQIDELEKAKLTEDEETELEHQRDLFRNSEKIVQSLSDAVMALCGDEDGGNLLDRMREGERLLSAISSYDPEYEAIHARISNLYYEMEDALGDLQRASDSFEFDQEESDRVEERLDLIRRLGRKYGRGTRTMLNYLQTIRQELEDLQSSEVNHERLRKKTHQLKSELKECSSRLSGCRRSAAAVFEKEVEKRLHELGMKNARFVMQFEDSQELHYSPDGTDHVEMMFSANLGQPLKPLAKVASGGEMSRIMLAIKDITAQKPGVPRSMVFDEIDTGISGKTAQVVAEKMSNIGDHHQVISVTHLPQIAAMADEHFMVRKFETEGTTRTEVIKLTRAQRIDELARMIGGIGEDASAREHADNMLQAAAQRRSELRSLLDQPAGHSGDLL